MSWQIKQREIITQCPYCQQPFVASGKMKLGGVRVLRCNKCKQWVWQPAPAISFWLGEVISLVVVWVVADQLIPSWQALLAWRTEPALVGIGFSVVALLVINPLVFQFIAIKKQRQLKQNTPPPNDNRPIEI